jgi:hypothetical protein
MRPIEDYWEGVDILAREVVDTWADNLRVGTAHSLNDDFKVLFDRAFKYREATLIAESHRKLSILTAAEAVNEQTARERFVEIYKSYQEKQESSRFRRSNVGFGN